MKILLFLFVSVAYQCIGQIDSVMSPNKQVTLNLHPTSFVKFIIPPDSVFAWGETHIEIGGGNGIKITTYVDGDSGNRSMMSIYETDIILKSIHGSNESSIIFTADGGASMHLTAINSETNRTSRLMFDSGGIYINDSSGKGIQFTNGDPSSTLNMLSLVHKGFVLSTKKYIGNQKFNATTDNAGMTLGSFASDPVNSIDGEVYYNTTLHKVRVKINGAWSSLQTE
jgi:hypothetical protein